MGCAASGNNNNSIQAAPRSGRRRRKGNYHGVGIVLQEHVRSYGSSGSRGQVTSQLSECSEAVSDYEGAAYDDDDDSLRRRLRDGHRRSAKKKTPKARAPRRDRLLNFGSFRIHMVDELAGSTAAAPRSRAVSSCTLQPGSSQSLSSSSSDQGTVVLGGRVLLGPPSNGVKTPRVSARREIRHYTVESAGGHPRKIKFAFRSPTDDLLLSCCVDTATIVVHHLRLGCEVGRLVGHDDAILGGDISADGRVFATASRDYTVVVWDVTTCKMRLSLTHPGVVFCCRLDPSSDALVSSCQDGVLRVWGLHAGRILHSFGGHCGLVFALSYNMDGSHILTGGSEKVVTVWTAEGISEGVFQGHVSGIISIQSQRGGKGEKHNSARADLALSADERLVHVWHMHTQVVLFTVDVCVCTLPRAPATSRKVFWTAATFIPHPFTGYIVVSSSTGFVHVFDCYASATVTQPGDVAEALALLFRSSVTTLSGNADNIVVLGDLYGNTHQLHLS